MEDVAGVFTAFLIALVPLALFVTKATDTVRNAVDARARLPKVTWNIVPFVLGIALMLGFPDKAAALSVLAHSIPGIGNPEAFDGAFGAVLMGLVVGAGAGFWHEKLDEWHSRAVASRGGSKL